VHIAGAVEGFAHCDPARVFARRLDVGDDQVQATRGAGCCRGDVPAEDDRGAGAGGRELDHAPVAARREVGIEPPAEAGVESLGAIDVGNGDDDDLELHVDRPRGIPLNRLSAAHGSPLQASKRWIDGAGML
jgi:hypothetical protein